MLLDKMSLKFALQALLQRHESYVASAEEDRARLLAKVERLEQSNREMLAENERIAEENRNLQEQLEGLNEAVAAADAHASLLTQQLARAQDEMRSLAVSAARASELEGQVAALEAEQAALQRELAAKREDERSAVQRWRSAESMLRDLQAQLERLEVEAREEREQHARLIAQMERRRAVERELDGAAGRLKGAAAATAVFKKGSSSTVVSKFVRDLLQDNANLQMGIVELRAMLENSYQEVEHLREQILRHHQQPESPKSPRSQQQQQSSSSSSSNRLEDELARKAAANPRAISHEFHVHHHYHPATPISRKERFAPRRVVTPKKKQQKRLPAIPQSPRSHRSHASASSMSSQASFPERMNRYSGVSSLASSPQSAGYRASSIFDIVDDDRAGFPESRPTSPESAAVVPSPKLPFGRRFSWSLEEDDDDKDNPPPETSSEDPTPAIPEEEDPEAEISPQQQQQQPQLQQRRHKRASSTDSLTSLLSISGMDIHTTTTATTASAASPTTPTRRRPSSADDNDTALRFHSRYFAALRPRRLLSPGTELSSTPPVLSTATSVTPLSVSPLSQKRSVSSRDLLLASLGSPPNHHHNQHHHHHHSSFLSSFPLPRSLSWQRSKNNESSPSNHRIRPRPPGINQPGPLPRSIPIPIGGGTTASTDKKPADLLTSQSAPLQSQVEVPEGMIDRRSLQEALQ